jgi:hypothetical protein
MHKALSWCLCGYNERKINMNNPIYESIKKSIDAAPRNGYVAELHLQVIKHAELLESVSGKDFCAQLNLGPAWGSEFSKMKKISARLRKAGLNPDKI